jgi:hypothetical protein
LVFSHAGEQGKRTTGRRVASGLAIVVVAALGAAGCTSGHGTATNSSASPPGSEAFWPALTQADAQAAFAHYTAVSDQAARAGDESLALSVVQGAAEDTLYAQYRVARATQAAPPYTRYAYGAPTYYLPEPPVAGSPEYFVVSVKRSPLPGTTPLVSSAEDVAAGVPLPASGTVLLLFEKAASGGPWQVASISQLAPGESVPALATDQHGYVLLNDFDNAGTKLVSPGLTPPLDATVVDDGPSSAASQVVASGPLTTGMYETAATSARGVAPPSGDVYQWLLEGSGYGRLSLETADGGSLVLYAMYFNLIVSTKSSLNEDVPALPGPAITVPAYVRPFLSPGQWTPRTKLETQDILSFAAIDPPAASKPAKIQVIAIGGGLNRAFAS